MYLPNTAPRGSCARPWLVWPDGREVVELGELHGTLTFAPRGSNGFGYDPIFEVQTPATDRARPLNSTRNTNTRSATAVGRSGRW